MIVTIKMAHYEEEYTYTVVHPKRSFGIIKYKWDRYPDFYEYLIVDGVNIDHEDLPAFLMIMGIDI